MARDDQLGNTGTHKHRTPIGAALILIGIYIVVYLAVGGLIHLLTAPEATAAVVPGSWLAAVDPDCFPK